MAAATALLERRSECFDAKSVVCLDDVDQRGSVALDADRNAVRSLQEGLSPTSPRLSGRTVTLVERLGNSALLALSPSADGSTVETVPASLLILKSEAGWRIRDVLLGEVPATG